MVLNKIKEMTIDKLLLKKNKREIFGLIHKLSLKISGNHTLRECESFRLVMPYELLSFFLAFLMSSQILKFIVHPDEVNRFKSILDLLLIGSALLFTIMQILTSKDLEELSIAVDGWWTYKYLEQEALVIKKNIERKLDDSTRVFINFVSFCIAAYVILPFFKYIYNGAKIPADMLLVECFDEEPWVYLEILSGVISVTICGNNIAYIFATLISTSFIHKQQLRLAAMAFSTVEDRAIRMMGEQSSRVNKTFENVLSEEIKSCVRHYQAINKQTKRWYQINNILLNGCIYVGSFVVTIVGVLLAKGNANIFLVVRVVGITLITLGVLFVICYPLDTLQDEVEEFRIQVYGSVWYNFPLPCQRTIHIMQTMLMYGPKYKTLWGSEVSLEYFGKSLNATYYYITAILSMVDK